MHMPKYLSKFVNHVTLNSKIRCCPHVLVAVIFAFTVCRKYILNVNTPSKFERWNNSDLVIDSNYYCIFYSQQYASFLYTHLNAKFPILSFCHVFTYQRIFFSIDSTSVYINQNLLKSGIGKHHVPCHLRSDQRGKRSNFKTNRPIEDDVSSTVASSC